MSENEVIRARYDQMVASWRALHLRTREELSAMLGEYRVYFAYNSGRIENAAVTYHDTREVFENGKAVGYTGDVRTLFEIQNQKECHELMLDAFAIGRPLDVGFVLEVHRALTQGTYDERRWARDERPGMFKLNDYVVGPTETGCPPAMVQSEVEGLVDELAAASPANILTAAAYFHAAFESVHPFADGNGRVGRALMNYLLISNNHPPIIIYDDDKLAYYGALQVWDDEEDLAPMVDFLRAEAVKTWHKRL